MLTLSAGAQAALAAKVTPMALLVEMQLAAPVYLCTAGVDLVYDGKTWVGIGLLGSMDEISDAIGDYKPVRFSLSSVPNEVLGLALGEAVKGRKVVVHLTIHNPTTYALEHVQRLWAGELDQMTVEEGAQSGQVSVTAVHRSSVFARPRPFRYTDADQQARYPGDASLQFLPSQAGHNDIWPSVAYLQR
jgi:hypothetical protein